MKAGGGGAGETVTIIINTGGRLIEMSKAMRLVELCGLKITHKTQDTSSGLRLEINYL